MTTGSLLLMVGVGLAAIAAGIVLLLGARGRRREAARYVSRLAAVMFVAVGMILIVFAGSWTLAA